jgi:hypothetical protein
MKFDLPMSEELLAPTRSVRKRLDLEWPVPRQLILDCLELAVRAPTQKAPTSNARRVGRLAASRTGMRGSKRIQMRFRIWYSERPGWSHCSTEPKISPWPWTV